MANYDENMKVLFGGHNGLFDNEKFKMQNANIPARNSDTDTADIRDILTNIVGNSYKGITDDNIRAQYAKLSGIVGITKAQKLLDTALIFNQKPENMKNSVEQRVQSFFNAGAADKDLNTIIQKAAVFGQGPIAGLNQSVDVGNQKLSGNYSTLPNGNTEGGAMADVLNLKTK